MRKKNKEKSRVELINNELKDNLATITQLINGYSEVKADGSKEDVLFYSDLIIDSYEQTSKLFIQLHNETINQIKKANVS